MSNCREPTGSMAEGEALKPGEDADGNAAISPKTMASLRLTNTAQAEQIEAQQQQLNEAQVKHGEEVYWLRLELDSSRREKEAVEDRMAELYRGVQELLTSSLRDEEPGDNDEVAELCTEPDYVHALQERVTAYERSVEILNRQIEMMKASSEVVVTSMKQEVTDLVEEKSLIERDLLNQISNLDNTKRELERELELSKMEDSYVNVGVKPCTLPCNETAQNTSSESETETPTRVEDVTPSVNSGDNIPLGIEKVAMEALAFQGKHHEESFRSTTTTQGSSFTNDVTPSVPIMLSNDDDEAQGQSMLVQSLCEEVAKWKEEASALETANLKLQGKVEQITKELIFTRSSANVALALDRIENDKAETLAHLDRIAVLWDRADSTIQVMEGLLAQFQQPRTESSESHPSNEIDRERLLSTLETATLVHGQIKMSLMLIELTFRNHLACIQNDNLQELQNVHVSNKLEQVRTDTLTAIAEAETKWGMAVEQVEKQIFADAQSTNDALSLQLNELQQAQDKHKQLENELKAIKLQSPSKPANDGPAKTENELAELVATNATRGFVVSHSVMGRLQKEILSTVAVIQEKNEAIQLLMTTIDKYKVRENALKKEVKRVALKAQKKVKTRDEGNAVKRNRLDLPRPGHNAARSSRARKGNVAVSKRKAGREGTALVGFPFTFPFDDVATQNDTPSSPSSLAHPQQNTTDGSDQNRGWSTL